MQNDIFDDLRDWGLVLDQLRELRSKHTLDDHQDGLVRILRYRDNWRLREPVLGCARHLTRPSDELLSEILAIVLDHDTYYEMRIMAVQTLSILCSRMMQDRHAQYRTANGILARLADLLDNASPPVFHDAVAGAVEELQSNTP